MSYSPSHLRRHRLPYARRALRRNLRALLRDYAYAFRYGARHVSTGVRREHAPQGDGPDVVVLTGIWEPYAFLHPLVDHLRRAGFHVHVSRRPSRNLASLPVLARRVGALLDQHDLRDVVVVAHSKGGLVAKQLLVEAGTRDRVRGAVAVCTPFNGSDLAGLLPEGWGVRSLVPGSRMLRELARHTDVNAHIVSIYPEYDPVVPSEDGNRLEGAHNVRIAEFGHFAILDEPHVLDAVVDAVRWLYEHPEGEPPATLPAHEV